MSLSPAIPDAKRQQMLEQRKLGIGGSDAASLFPEDSKYGCPTRLWYEKRNQRPDYERTEAEKKVLDRGNRFEETVAQLFSEEYGFKVRRHPTRVSRTNPILRVNIDRQIVNVTTGELGVYWQLKLDGECGPGVLECKTSNHWVSKEIVSSGIPVDYILQVQHALAVTDYRWGVMAVLNTSTLDLVSFPMLRNDRLIPIIEERADDFWPSVEAGKRPDPPEFPKGDKRCLGCPFRKSCRGTEYLSKLANSQGDEHAEAGANGAGYVVDDSYADLASDLRDIKSQIAVLEETEETIAGQIKKRMDAQGVSKIEIPAIGAKIRWAEQKPPYSWDGKALDAEGGTIGRHVHFAEWVQTLETADIELWMQKAKDYGVAGGQELLAEFCRQHPKSAPLADKYKRYGKPKRPFVPVFL